MKEKKVTTTETVKTKKIFDASEWKELELDLSTAVLFAVLIFATGILVGGLIKR